MKSPDGAGSLARCVSLFARSPGVVTPDGLGPPRQGLIALVRTAPSHPGSVSVCGRVPLVDLSACDGVLPAPGWIPAVHGASARRCLHCVRPRRLPQLSSTGGFRPNRSIGTGRFGRQKRPRWPSTGETADGYSKMAGAADTSQRQCEIVSSRAPAMRRQRDSVSMSVPGIPVPAAALGC